MNTKTRTKAENSNQSDTPRAEGTERGAPEIRSARATVRVAGSDTGAVRLECQLPADYTAEDVRRHMRIKLPGEVTALDPTDVRGEGGHYSVGFMSSAVANAGKVPADCVAGWSEKEQQWIELEHIPLESEMEAEAHGRGQETGHEPAAHSAAYPRTVGVAALFAIFVGIIILILFLLQNA